MTTTLTTPEPKTKETLLDAAEDLMLEKGFVATSVDEICAEAKVTKGSFFYYFKSKDALGKLLVQRFSAKMGHKLMETIHRHGTDPREKLFGFIDFAIEMGGCCEGKGCLIGTFTQELSETHPELRLCCEESFVQLRKLFETELKAALKLYGTGKKVDTQGIAEQFIATIQGSLLLIKATQDRSVMKRTMQNFKNYLQLILQN
jgi:TetR/AcrR family transcriptional repressor of nem operon